MTLFLLIGLTPKVTAGYTPGGSPFFRRVAHLGTFVNDQLGVVIDPQGLAMHSADTVHLPVVIHLALPEWSSLQIPDLSTAYCPPFEPNGSCLSDCCSNGTCAAFPIISQQIDKIRREMKESYQGILDTRYYAGLMKSYCQDNPTLCDQSPEVKANDSSNTCNYRHTFRPDRSGHGNAPILADRRYANEDASIA